jgi:hypothetical protein
MANLTMTTYAEARTRDHSDETGGWWVFWETASSYGARGLNLSKARAEALAERIREHGPAVT